MCPGRQGTNYIQSHLTFRIGITTNDGGCSVTYSSTWIGVGLRTPLWCHKFDENFSGGYEYCSPVGKKHFITPALTYIYIK